MSAPYFLERDNENNARNVIDSFLSLYGSATTVPNRNGKLPIGLLIASGVISAEGVGIVLRTNSAALLYKNIGLSGLPYIL